MCELVSHPPICIPRQRIEPYHTGVVSPPQSFRDAGLRRLFQPIRATHPGEKNESKPKNASLAVSAIPKGIKNGRVVYSPQLPRKKIKDSK